MNSTSLLDLTIENVTAKLEQKDKAEFFDKFWPTWAANGYGTLTKKDTELLLFACLKRAFGAKGPQNNYRWAKLLRLTPSKIKSMRLEAYLRFGHLFDESSSADTSLFLNNVSHLQSIDLNGLGSGGTISDVTVSFVVEDPVVQMEVENHVKTNGGYLDFHRNREVIKIRLISFLSLVAEPEQKQFIDRWVEEKSKETAKSSSLVKRVLAKDFANKTEAGKLLALIDDLSAVAKVKPLVDLLKKVFASQSERK